MSPIDRYENIGSKESLDGVDLEGEQAFFTGHELDNTHRLREELSVTKGLLVPGQETRVSRVVEIKLPVLTIVRKEVSGVMYDKREDNIGKDTIPTTLFRGVGAHVTPECRPCDEVAGMDIWQERRIQENKEPHGHHDIEVLIELYSENPHAFHVNTQKGQQQRTVHPHQRSHGDCISKRGFENEARRSMDSNRSRPYSILSDMEVESGIFDMEMSQTSATGHNCMMESRRERLENTLYCQYNHIRCAGQGELPDSDYSRESNVAVSSTPIEDSLAGMKVGPSKLTQQMTTSLDLYLSGKYDDPWNYVGTPGPPLADDMMMNRMSSMGGTATSDDGRWRESGHPNALANDQDQWVWVSRHSSDSRSWVVIR